MSAQRERTQPPKRPDPVPRVLHVVGSMNLGGAETMLMNVYRTIDTTRLQFDFLVFDHRAGAYEAEIMALGGRVLRVAPPAGLGFIGAVENMAATMTEHGPFVAVHSHVNLASGMALAAAARAGVVRRIAHSHSTADTRAGIVRRGYRFLSRAAIGRYATSLVACSHPAGEYLFGRDWRRFGGTVVRNCIQTHRFLAVSEDAVAQVRRDAAIATDAMMLGAVGRLEPVKNQDFLLEVVELCSRAGKRVNLLLVGEGSLADQLAENARSRGIDQQVRFLGARDDIPSFMRSLDLFLLPSRHEGIPLVLVEAQASGIPALVSANVTSDVDLGLGLLSFLSIDSPQVWAEAVGDHQSVPRTPDEIEEAVLRNGYDASQAAAVLFELYGL